MHVIFLVSVEECCARRRTGTRGRLKLHNERRERKCERDEKKREEEKKHVFSLFLLFNKAGHACCFSGKRHQDAADGAEKGGVGAKNRHKGVR